MEGGVTQGIGWALSEELRLDRGRLLNPNFTDYVIPTSADAPTVRIALIESDSSGGPYGAKGLGEHVLIPTAPAILNAIAHATGARITQTPATPSRVLAAIRELPSPGIPPARPE